jgi:hypothetical protein
MAEEDKKRYYRLFIPLLNKQKEDVFQLWMENIQEDIFIRKQIIKEYCDNNKCDFMMALFHIYKFIENKYYCDYCDEENEYIYKYFKAHDLIQFLKKDFIIIHGSYTEEVKENIKFILDVLRKTNKFDNYYEDFYSSINHISREYVINEEIDLKICIDSISKERYNNPDEFNNNPLNAPCEIENYDSFPEIEKQMYYKKPNSRESYNLYLQKRKIIFIT